MYKVVTKDHTFGVGSFDVETYYKEGFDIYKYVEIPITDIESEMNQISVDLNNAVINKYYAKKDSISFQIQPFRIPEFYNRGYTIFIKKLEKIDNLQEEINKINATMNV